jgi:hypothetical protein
MHIRVMTIASALALLAGPALAQSPSTGGPVRTPGPPPITSQPAAQPPAPVVNPLTMEDVSQVKGAPVYGSDDKKIGSVSTVLMKPESKTIDRMVVGAGGMLGVGTHYVVLPITDFTWDAQAAAFKIAKTTDDVKAMPEWHEQVGEMPSATPATTTPAQRPGGDSSAPAVPGAKPTPLTPAPDEGRI